MSSKSTCRSCLGKHHSLLHYTGISSPHLKKHQQQQVSAIAPSSPPGSAQTLTTIVSSEVNVILATAQVEIPDKWGNYRTVRVLLDSGSQTHIITKKCAASSGLSLFKSFLCIQGIDKYSSPSSSRTLEENCSNNSLHYTSS